MDWHDTALRLGLRDTRLEVSNGDELRKTKNDPWQPAQALLIFLTVLTSRENFFWIISQVEAKALFLFLFWSWLRRNV